jgi:hypothetical protein
LLRYFRINDPYRLLALLVLLIMVCLPLFVDPAELTMPELKSIVLGEKVVEGYTLYSEVIDDTPPLAAWLYGVADFLFGRTQLGRHILAFLILFLQSAFLGFILIDKRAFPENTFIPTLVFSLLTLISFDLFSLTADLAAFGFLLLALNAMLNEIEFRTQRDETIFNLGFFISTASLLTFSYILFFPGLVLILILFTRNTPRKYLLMATGFLLPHLLVFSYYYLLDQPDALWNRFYAPGISFSGQPLISLTSLLVLTFVPLAYILISMLFLNRNAHLTKYQSQVLQAMFLWLIVSLIQVYFTTDLRPQSLLPVFPPVVFFLTHFFLLIRRKKFAEISLWVLFIGIVSTLYLARYQKILKVDYAHLEVPTPSVSFSGKRVLVLDDDFSVYLSNTASPPFLNWKLTKTIFDGPQYYENVLLVNRLFEMDPPEIILDPENRLEKFVGRIPLLKNNYSQSPNGQWILNN